jgi:hypothetical protein
MNYRVIEDICNRSTDVRCVAFTASEVKKYSLSDQILMMGTNIVPEESVSLTNLTDNPRKFY